VGDVADLGCGPADDGALLARAGHRVAGIDRSAGMLAYAARVLPGGWLALVTAAGQEARLEPVPYAPRTRRWFFYRDPGQLYQQLHDAGLHVTAMTEEPTSRHWLKFLARAA
jgi:SAM-dependent methyltransferase